MNITEVRSFLILAGQRHFGRAARLLHLSQPALTKQIRRLEEELGGPLLVSGTRSIGANAHRWSSVYVASLRGAWNGSNF